MVGRCGFACRARHALVLVLVLVLVPLTRHPLAIVTPLVLALVPLTRHPLAIVTPLVLALVLPLVLDGAVCTHLPEPGILVDDLDIVGTKKTLARTTSGFAIVPMQMDKDALPRLTLVIRPFNHIDPLIATDVKLPEDRRNSLL